MDILPHLSAIAPLCSDGEPIDATINNWFQLIRRIQLLKEASSNSSSERLPSNCTTPGTVITDATDASATIETLVRFLDESEWLYSGHKRIYHRDTNNRLGSLMHGLRVMYEYCCTWGRQSAQHLSEEADQAFKQLYCSLKLLTDRLLQYIRSADFQEQICVVERNCWDRGHHIIFDVLNSLVNIITVIADFDMRSASSMWSCILLLITNHTAAIRKASESTVANWLNPTLTHLYEKLVRSTKSSDNLGVVDGRKISLATYYAKIVLQMCTVYTDLPNYGLFSQFAINYLVVKENLIGCEQSKVEPLLVVLDKILPAIYGHVLEGKVQFQTSAASVLHMYSTIQSMLLRETRIEVLTRYANVAFNIEHIATLLEQVAFTSATPIEDFYRPAVSRLTALIVLTSRKCPHLVQTIDDLLFSAMHSNHYYRSTLALDIWLLRSEFLQPQQLQHYVLQVFCTSLGTAILCHRPSSVFFRRLLCHYYAKLPREWRLGFNRQLLGIGEGQCSAAEKRRVQQLVWLVLGIRLVHPDEHSALQQVAIDRYQAAEANYRRDPQPSHYYAYALALHGLRGSRQPQITTALSGLCDQLHPNWPQIFHMELEHLLANAAQLSDHNVRDALRSMVKFQAATASADDFWHTLIALQGIKLLGWAMRKEYAQNQMREECAQLGASLFAELLHHGDAVVQLNCWRQFFELAAEMGAHRDIIGRTISGSKQLKLQFRRWAQRSPTAPPTVASGEVTSCLLDSKYGHICRGLFVSFSSSAISLELRNWREKLAAFLVLSERGTLTQEHALELDALGDAFDELRKERLSKRGED